VQAFFVSTLEIKQTRQRTSRMKVAHSINKMVMVAVVLAAPFTAAMAQTILGTPTIDGVIVTRDGDSFMMRAKSGSVTNVTVTTSTKINEGLGLLGVRTEAMSSSALVPGLRLSVEPESPGQKVVAKSIKFSTNDLETADAIQAALSVPLQQIQALTQELAAQKQLNAHTARGPRAANRRNRQAHRRSRRVRPESRDQNPVRRQ
jgi:hypothetical protein